jgi:putative membrane protein
LEVFMNKVKTILATGTALSAGLLLSASFALGQASPRTGPPETTEKMNPFEEKASPMAVPATRAGISASDSSFLRKAAEGGVAEVALGNLAKDKATDPDVKQFAQKMVDDHSKANVELKKLANQKGVAVPGEADSKTNKEMDKLSKLSGPEFDKAYMKLMVSDHQKDVAEFNTEYEHTSDPDVKDFVGKTLPTLQEHLRMAREDHTKVTGKAS